MKCEACNFRLFFLSVKLRSEWNDHSFITRTLAPSSGSYTPQHRYFCRFKLQQRLTHRIKYYVYKYMYLRYQIGHVKTFHPTLNVIDFSVWLLCFWKDVRMRGEHHCSSRFPSEKATVATAAEDADLPLAKETRNVGSCIYGGIIRNIIGVLTGTIQCRLSFVSLERQPLVSWKNCCMFEWSGAWRKEKGPDILQWHTLQGRCVCRHGNDSFLGNIFLSFNQLFRSTEVTETSW